MPALSDTHPPTSRPLLTTTAALSAAVGCLIAMALLGAATRLPGLLAWDESVLRTLGTDRNYSVAGWMGVLSAIGGGAIAIPIGLAIAWFLHRAEPARARAYLATVLSGWALSFVLKAIFQRPRPGILPHLDSAGGYSYPSGHTMLAPLVFALGGYLLFRPAPARRLGAAAGMALAGLIGLSRVDLSVHYPSDVIGALLAGCGWSLLAVGWLRRPRGG